MAARNTSGFDAMCLTHKAAARNTLTIRSIAFVLLSPFRIILHLVGFMFRVHRIAITTRLRVVCCAVCVRFGLFRVIAFCQSISFTFFSISFSISNALLCTRQVLLTFCDACFRLCNRIFDFVLIVRVRLFRGSNLLTRNLFCVVQLGLNTIKQATGKIVAPLVARLTRMRGFVIEHIETLCQFGQLSRHGFRLFFHCIALSLTIIFQGLLVGRFQLALRTCDSIELFLLFLF